MLDHGVRLKGLFKLSVPQCHRAIEVELRPARGLVDGAKVGTKKSIPLHCNEMLMIC